MVKAYVASALSGIPDGRERVQDLTRRFREVGIACIQTWSQKDDEAGYAMACEKMIILVGPKLNIFFKLPEVAKFETVEQCLSTLKLLNAYQQRVQTV